MPLSDDVEFVRFLISDPDSSVFSDTEIEMVLGRQPAVYLAGALLLDRIADNEALISKKIRTQDLSTDGPAVAKSLREAAAQLRADHAASVEADSAGVVITEFDPHAGYPSPELVARPSVWI